MIARLNFLLPFSVQIPQDERFNVYAYEVEGYEIRVYPPGKSDVPSSAGSFDTLRIDGRNAVSVNALRIDFYKSEFDRSAGTQSDPPFEFIEEVVNSFLRRLRYVTKATRVHTVKLTQSKWQLRYLDDNGGELEAQKDLVRGRGTLGFNLEYIGLTNDVWDHIHELPADFAGPVWHELLLDALNELPHVGAAIVLAATALEVLVAQTLDELAKRSQIPSEIWKWINEREWLKVPSTEEQYDYLLQFLAGRSLKANPELWQAFKNLKQARNTFVHEGVPRIGKTPVDEKTAGSLIVATRQIVAFIREDLPEDLKWPEFTHQHEVVAEWQPFKPAVDA